MPQSTASGMATGARACGSAGRPGPRPLILPAICGDLPEDPPAVTLRIHVLPVPAGDPPLVTVVLEPLPATEDEDRADVLIDRFLQILRRNVCIEILTRLILPGIHSNMRVTHWDD